MDTAGSGAPGTNTSFATIVLLPVPFMPAMNQVSSTVTSPIGISDRPEVRHLARSFFM